ncbi:hypothetical protein C1646_822771 [Rhizophagus diaphanus]|nr:hypothetical protein C1646_822771 [Rhizophagus diaphanus] [Rhizophagus sp. MUCL 43196]
MQSTDSLRELNAKLLVEITELRKENAEIPELREKLLKFAEVEAEKVKLRRELEAKNDELYKTIAHFSSKIVPIIEVLHRKLNIEIVELKKDKTAITKLESKHAEFRDRVMKVEQRQMHNDNSSNINLSNINSVADQVSKANSHHEKPLVDKEMDTLLSEELISEMIAKQSASAVNISVMEQCDQTSLEDKEMDAFLNEASSISQDISFMKVITTSQKNNDDDIEFTKTTERIPSVSHLSSSLDIMQTYFKNKVDEICHDTGALNKTARSQIYKEMLEHLPGITLENLLTFSVYDISSLTINQIQSVIKNVTLAKRILEVPNCNHVTSVMNCNDQINVSAEHAKLSGLPNILTDKFRSNLCKRYKKETENEPWQVSRTVTSMLTNSQASDFKPITFEVRPDPELIIKSVLEHFLYLKFQNSFRGIDNYNFASLQP